MSKSEMCSVFVTLKIKKECVEDFLKVMETDMIESRKEAGCLRFDVLRQDDPKPGDGEGVEIFNLFEMYINAEAMAVHKTLPHYLAWAEFKKDPRAPVVQQDVVKMMTAFGESK